MSQCAETISHKQSASFSATTCKRTCVWTRRQRHFAPCFLPRANGTQAVCRRRKPTVACRRLRKSTKEPERNEMTTNPKGTSAVQSPYTAQNVDAAIAHLERVLSSEGAHSLFGQTYWRVRVMQVRATSGLMHTQRARLQRLLDLIADAAGTSPHQSPGTENAPAENMHI
jgi:hypothetical protein